MNNAPKVKPGDWIAIGTVDCLVIELHADKPTRSDIDVICNFERPAVYGANWTGEHWTFEHPMRGDYAEHHPAADAYVERLKAGRPGKG